MDEQLVQAFNRGERVDHFRRNLPHWQQRGSTYFVTFRLADSLPTEIVKGWLRDRKSWLTARGLKSPDELHTLPEEQQREFSKQFVGRIERALDHGNGTCILKRPEIAAIVAGALRFFHLQRYCLEAAVVMPNHVHALVTPAPDHRLGSIVQTWKSFTAKEINRLNGTSGRVWQAESYDHIVRNDKSWWALREYILNNPSKAQLRAGEYVLIEPEKLAPNQ